MVVPCSAAAVRWRASGGRRAGSKCALDAAAGLGMGPLRPRRRDERRLVWPGLGATSWDGLGDALAEEASGRGRGGEEGGGGGDGENRERRRPWKSASWDERSRGKGEGGRRRKTLLTCGPCTVSYKLAPHGREIVLSSDL